MKFLRIHELILFDNCGFFLIWYEKCIVNFNSITNVVEHRSEPMLIKLIVPKVK